MAIMNRILKGRTHVASRRMAFGSATSSYFTTAVRRLKFMGRVSVATPKGRKQAIASIASRGRLKKSPSSSGKKQRRHDVPAADYTLDMETDVDRDTDIDTDIDMDIDVDTDNSPTFSMAWSSSSQAPSTPQSLFSSTALTPQSSGSSFSQTFGGTPCPANNAFAPLPHFSADMEGVVFTPPRLPAAPYNQQPAAPRAPPRANGVVPFSMQPATTAMQLDPQQKPAQAAAAAAAAAPRAPPRANGVLPFSMQPAPQQNTAQPAAAAAASGAPPRNGVVPFTMHSAPPQPATAARPTQPGLSGSRFAAAAAASAATARRPPRANGVMSFNMQPAASAPQLQAASQTAAQPSRSALPSGSLQAAARAASAAAARGPPRNGVLPFAMQSAAPQLPATQPSQSAAAAAASAAASRAPPRNGVLSFNMQPPTSQQQASPQPATEAMDAQPSQPAAFQPTFSQPAQTAQPQGLFGATPFRHASFWAKNDPGQVFKTPTWPMTISSLWAAALPHLSPDAQLGDTEDSTMTPAPQPSQSPAPAQPQRTLGEPAVAQAPSLAATKEAWASTLISAKNDPAQVFKAPSWSWVAVAPLWKTIQTLPQLAPRAQLWNIQDSIMTAAPQLPPSDFSKQVLPAAPFPSRQSDGTGIAQQSSSIDNDLEAAVGMMASLHVSEPATWAWTEATGFGPFVGKDEGKDYDIQMLAATMQLPDDDNDEEMNEAILQQQIAQEAAAASTEVALPHASGTLPAAEANGSSSVAPVQEQPAQAEAFQQKPSGSQPIDQTPAAVPAIAQAALTSGIPTQNGSSDEAMTTEASQPTDKGKGVAGTYQIDFTDIKFQVGNAGQLMDRLQQINNPFANSPSSPATIAPTSLQLFGQQIPLSVAPAANGAASQEQPYEVGSDKDPNIDPNFDFGKYFRRSAPTAVASASSAPDASASSSSAEVSSAGEPATSAGATPPTEASPSPEATLPDAPASSQAVLPIDTSSPVEPLSIKAPPPAEPFAFVKAPAVAASPLDEASFALAGTPSAPRGINKRRRDIDTYLDPDRPAEKVSIGYETRPMTPEEYDELWKEWAGDVVAELKANPVVLYNKEYAMEMMYNMFHTILPRVASEVMYPVPLYTQRYQDKQAQALMDAMTVEELYEKSYEMVEEMFEPTFDLEFPASRWNMFYLFSDWFVDYIAIELPDLPHRMEPDEIKELGKVFLPEIYNYMDTHPPEEGK